MVSSRKMKMDSSLGISFCVSFPSMEFDDNMSLLSSLVLICVSYFSSKTLIFIRNPNHRQHTPLPLAEKDEYEGCKNEVIIHAESSTSPRTRTSDTRCSIVVELGVDLPDDAWMEVLCRLPPKDMVTSKLVCKSWNSLISHVCIPKITAPLYGLFIPLGIPPRWSSGPQNPGTWDFACCLQGTGIHNNGNSFVQSCFATLPLSSPQQNYLLDSCNGFLLYFHYPRWIFLVVNPSTQQYLPIPAAPLLQFPRVANLFFTPHLNIISISFNPLQIFLYSSQTRQWEICSNQKYRYSLSAVTSSTHGALVDGVVHFLSPPRHFVRVKTQQRSILPVELPQRVHVRGPDDMGCIGVSTDRLHYAWDDHNTNQVFVWMHNTRSWVFKHSFSLLDLAKYSVPGICEDFTSLAPCAFHPTSDVLFLGHKAGIFRYDPTSEKLDCVYRVRNDATITCGRLMIFTQSLATMIGSRPKPKGYRDLFEDDDDEEVIEDGDWK